ncbi:FecR family protein [Oceanibaculum nanhaiense]|uniref:FecR family protein n=1 Tax=Oceanibaculum nanhaiense TaxID=1909734 RepID=UPI003F6F09DD
MPKPDFSDQDRIAGEASSWFARLQADDATAADRAGFRRWHDADARHARAWAEVTAIFDASAQACMSAPRARRCNPGRAPALALAAMLALAIGLSALLGPDYVVDLRSDYTTGTAERRQVMLADSSQVELNTGSAIALDWSDNERRIRLLRGEAYFQVKPDSARPFIVETPQGEVRAVGTAFAVRRDGDRVRVTVTQGIVAAGPKRGDMASLRLTAGQAVSFDKAMTLPVEKVDAQARTAWRQGQVVFRQRPLAEVLAALDRYRPGAILLLDSALGQRPVTGAFDIDDTDKALAAIEKVLGLHVRRVTPYLVLISAEG